VDHHPLPQAGEHPRRRVVGRRAHVHLDLLAVGHAPVGHRRTLHDHFEPAIGLRRQAAADLARHDVVGEVEVEAEVGDGLGVADRAEQVLRD